MTFNNMIATYKGREMKRPILIIMFLLLCPSLTSAGEEDGVVEESKMNYIENIIASNKIARDIFIHEAYSIYADPIRLSALLSATGYKNLSAEVMNDVGIVDTFDINWC